MFDAIKRQATLMEFKGQTLDDSVSIVEKEELLKASEDKHKSDIECAENSINNAALTLKRGEKLRRNTENKTDVRR
jgi:hypothetical protein